MRRKLGLLFVAALVAVVGGAAFAGPLSGSTKDPLTGDIHCGSTGKLVTAGGVNAYANTSSDHTEVEGCHDSGAGNSQGRFIVRVNHDTANPMANGARVSLDSDKDQTPS